MPTNTQMERCIASERGALVFWSPDASERRAGARVQIIDVFSLQVATGYTRDPQGRLVLEAQPFLAAGRSWSLAKASQLIRNDALPHRWEALKLDKRAWGLFWAGGGLQHCRDLLVAQAGNAESSSALVPATPEALLKLVLEQEAERAMGSGDTKPAPAWRRVQSANPWRVAAWISLAWMAVLGITVVSFLSVLKRQDRMLELLLERTAPSAVQPTSPLMAP
jgi:hypothetical protein